MNLRQNERKRIVHAPAKLNLFLEVLGKRADGYHELATLMVPIRLFDTLSFEPTPAVAGRPAPIEFSLRACDPASRVPADSSNLVVRALDLLRERSGCESGAKVELFKRIPTAAGLGGGSSDAAAALRVANRAWQIRWETEKLSSLAAELGSDVPFFLAAWRRDLPRPGRERRTHRRHRATRRRHRQATGVTGYGRRVPRVSTNCRPPIAFPPDARSTVWLLSRRRCGKAQSIN